MPQELKYEFGELDGKERLRELIVYISQKCSDDPTFGATKLNKLLFYSDFLAYFYHGQPISGVEYQRLPNGPAPKYLRPLRDEMVASGDILLREVGFYEKTQHRCIALRDPDLTEFKGTEIALLDELIDKLWGKTATEVSEMSHQRPWRIARDRESIPYQAIFLSDNDEFDETTLARVEELNGQHGWE